MNSTPIPQTKYNQIVERLNTMLHSGFVNEVELKKYKNEAEKLKEYNPPEAFTLFGIIACLEKKIKEMHLYHKKALTYSNNNPMYLLQYVTSLINVELFDVAYPYALEALENDQNNLQFIDALIKITYKIENYEEFIKYTSLWKKIKGELHPYDVIFPEDDDDKLSQEINKFDELIENNPELVVNQIEINHNSEVILFCTEHILSKYLGLAEKLIKENFSTVRKISFSVEDDPETIDKWVIADIEVYGEIDQVIAWEDEFVKKWVATVPYPERNMIRLSCDII